MSKYDHENYHKRFQEKDSLVKLGRDAFNFYRKYAIAFVSMIVISLIIAIISGQLGAARKEKDWEQKYQQNMKGILGFHDYEKFHPEDWKLDHRDIPVISINWDDFIAKDLINSREWRDSYDSIFYGSIAYTALYVLQLFDEYEQEAISNRAVRVRLEQELSNNSLPPDERKAKEKYLSKLIEEKVSTRGGGLTKEERKIISGKVYDKAHYFIDRARKHIPVIAKYSPFLKYKGNPANIATYSIKVPRNSRLGVTHGEMFESAKRILLMNMDHIENINSEMFMIEYSKGMAGKIKSVVETEGWIDDRMRRCASEGCKNSYESRRGVVR